MKNNFFKLIKKILLLIFFIDSNFLETINNEEIENYKEEDLIAFDFYGKKLEDLVQEIANLKKINILISSEIEKNEIIVNFSVPEKIPLYEVEEYLLYFLSMAGYILTYQDSVFILTKKNPALEKRYLVPLYVNVPPMELPDNPGMIRAIYFLKHLRVPDKNDNASNAIKDILVNILPGGKNDVMIDPRSNCVILTSPSNAIAAAMLIISELDKYGVRDEIAYLRLKHTNVNTLHKLLEDILSSSKDPGATANQNNLFVYNGAAYFSPQIKFIADTKNNGLIMLGKSDAINKIMNFIIEEIDIPLMSNKHFVHIYNLKYLDSAKIATILQDVVSNKKDGGDQSSQGASASIYKSFDNSRIIAEQNVPSLTKDGTPTKFTIGGNRLLIAATQSDYKVIEKLLESIDKPQPQIVIEIMILDLELDEKGLIASQFSIPPFAKVSSLGFQSVMMDSSRMMIDGMNGAGISSPTNLTTQSSLNSNLMAPFETDNGDNPITSESGGNISSLADNIRRGGLLISLGGQFPNANISSILNIDRKINKKNIIENPYLLTQNNITASIKSEVLKRGEGDISSSNTQYGGATVINVKDFKAELKINITPRINFGSLEVNPDGEIKINLEISVNIEDFKNSSTKNFDKIIRTIKTNTILSSGDLLVLGGLHKEIQSGTSRKTPFLSNIPVLGYFFKQSALEQESTNLVVIIKASIVDEQKLREFSIKKENSINSDLKELALGNIDDPIRRYYFSEAENVFENKYIDLSKEKKKQEAKAKITTEEVVKETNKVPKNNKREKKELSSFV